jgi:hypothetical protein
VQVVPLFIASNVTVPVWTVCVENANLNSVIPTVTVEAGAGALVFVDFFSPACFTLPPSVPAFAGPSLPSSPKSQRSSPCALPARALPAA